MPVALTSRVLPPTILPVFGVVGEMQLTVASVNDEGSTPLTAQVPVMVVPVGLVVLNEPPEVPEVTELVLPAPVPVVRVEGAALLLAALAWRRVRAVLRA